MLSVTDMAQGFPTFGIDARDATLAQAQEIITRWVWSHIVWAGGTRGEQYFSCSYFCALDVDEGPTIAETVAKLDRCKADYILGITKSHDIEKSGKPACDRFRILMRWEDPIWDFDVFRWNMKQAIKWIGSDPAYDGSRIWQPCKEIYCCGTGGGNIPVDYDVPEEETAAHRDSKAEKWAQWRRKHKVLPRRTMTFLQKGSHSGNRNRELYFAALALLEFGHTVEDVHYFCKEAPGMKELEGFEDTLKSACRRLGEEYA